MTAESLDIGANCAHLRVVWTTKQNDNGTTSGWWECDFDCGTRFIPFPVPDWNELRESMNDAAKGRVLPWRIAMLPLPRWAFSLVFAIAPYIWGRKVKKLASQKRRSAHE